MSGRLPRLLVVFMAFLAVGLGAILYFTVPRSGPISIPTAAIGGPFRLVDQNGAPFTDQNLKGKTFLVFFGFTHCPDVCPTTLFEISEIMRKLGSDADRTAVLFITVDPERDTPESIKDYLASFDPHIRGLTGDAAVSRPSPRPIASTTRKCRSKAATTPWTIPRSSISWARTGSFSAPST